ncbi:hypothetical protein CHUAL_006227 [Chamberlinius hualienensis]
MAIFLKMVLLLMAVVGKDFANAAGKLNYGQCSTDENSTCTFWCTIASAENITNFAWNYYTYDVYANYTFSEEEGVNSTYVEETDILNITLNTHPIHPGYYVCQFYEHEQTKIDSKLRYVFNDGKPNVGIGDNCTSESECLAVFSYCDDHVTNNDTATCNCHGTYNRTYDERSDTPACVIPAAWNETCQSNHQCGDNMACTNEYCECAEKYELSLDGLSCLLSNTSQAQGLTTAAVAGIVVGCVGGVAIIGGILYYT